MYQFKQWLKEFLALVICICIALSPIAHIYAEDYVKNDSDEDGVYYYIIEGKDVDSLFDFSVYDVGDTVQWVQQFKTFTVIKAEKDDSGNDQYTLYFNTPNLQSIVKNTITSNITDGYTDHTYNVNETKRLVDVGSSATNKDAIATYGFKIPCYTYMGEYPKATMSVAGITPSGFWSGLWRGIKSLFTGCSFLSAPDAENFNSIKYHNHTYKDESEFVLDIFKNYYLNYFERKICVDSYDGDAYFTGPKDFLDRSVSKDSYDKASNYVKTNAAAYAVIEAKLTAWNVFEKNNNEDKFKDPVTGTKYTTNGFGSTEFDIYRSFTFDGISVEGVSIDGVETTNFEKRAVMRSQTYRNAFYTWANTHKSLVKAIYKQATGSDVDPASFDPTQSVDDGTFTNFIYVIDTNITQPDKKNKKDKKVTSVEYEDTDTKFDIDDYNSYFEEGIAIKLYKGFVKEDFMTTEDSVIYDEYNTNSETCTAYENFTDMFNIGDQFTFSDAVSGNDADKYRIFYKQCLIENKGKDEECWSDKYGSDKVTLSIADVYASSGLYKLTEDYDDDTDVLTDVDAQKIIKKLQSYCGPYYSEVLSNMLIIMAIGAIYDGDYSVMKRTMESDPRIMPYDTSTMVEADKENYSNVDPRVEIYKSHIVGGLVSNITLNWGFGIYFKFQRSIINVAGLITEMSVLFYQLSNFDKIEAWGLSPTNLWTGFFPTFLMGMLAIYFILKTVISLIKMGTKSGVQIVMGFLVLLMELALFTAISLNPDKIWSTIKRTVTTVSNLGEMSTTYDNKDLDYLYADITDQAVTYYMPYLDIWSKYNTGYGLLKDEQLIDTTKNLPELKEITLPTVNGNEIKHYSIMLADSFTYHGDSTSVTTSVIIDSKTCNGPTINNNAYRVVDHFLAPRVEVTKNGDKLSLSTSENENYNGEFQSGVIDLIVKLLNCILCCWVSLIKMLTFFWQWYMLYIFIFKAVLGKLAEHKTWKDILIETFSPMLCMIFIGIYLGVVCNIGMTVEGMTGLLIEIFLLFFTGYTVCWWHKLKNGQLFPGSLLWMWKLLSLVPQFRPGGHTDAEGNKVDDSRRHERDVIYDTTITARENNFEISEEDVRDTHKFTKKIFNDDGTRKDINENNRMYDNWRELIRIKEARGKQLSVEEQIAKERYDSDMAMKKVRNKSNINNNISDDSSSSEKPKTKNDDKIKNKPKEPKT